MTSSPPVFSHRSKTEALGEHLLNLARRLGPEAKLPTMQELRRELNVSIATLDGALSRLEAQKIIYRKHGVGVFVSPRLGERRVGLVMAPEFFSGGTSPFWQQLIERTRASAGARTESFGFYVALPGHDDSPVNEDLAEDIRARRLDGVLFIGNNEAAVNWIEEHDVPVVCFAGRAAHTVELNYERLIDIGVNELCQQGCRSIALIKRRDWEEQFFKFPRLAPLGEHFVQQLEAHGLPFRPEYLQDAAYFPDGAETYQMQGFEAVNRLWNIEGIEPLDAILINDDMMACGALVAINKLGLKVGQDVRIATHLNQGSAVLHGREDDLSLVEFDTAHVVSALFGSLDARINGSPEATSITCVEPHIHAHLGTKTLSEI